MGVVAAIGFLAATNAICGEPEEGRILFAEDLAKELIYPKSTRHGERFGGNTDPVFLATFVTTDDGDKVLTWYTKKIGRGSGPREQGISWGGYEGYAFTGDVDKPAGSGKGVGKPRPVKVAVFTERTAKLTVTVTVSRAKEEQHTHITLTLMKHPDQTASFMPPSAQEKPEARYKGKPLAYWVQRLQKSKSDQGQKEAAEAIKAFGTDAGPAVPELIQLLGDHSDGFRSMVKDLLCALGPTAKTAAPGLVKSLKEGSWLDPRDAVEILGAIGPEAKDAVPVLTATLNKNRELCGVVIEALCQIGPAAKETLPDIRRAIRDVLAQKDKYYWASSTLLRPLSGLGPEAVPLLLEFLDEKDADGKSACAEALGKIGPAAKRAVAKLEELLKHEAPFVRRDAACALWRIDKNPAVIPVLIALLDEHVDLLIEPAVNMLGEIGPEAKGALPALRELSNKLSGNREDLADAARRAIQKIEGNR